MAARSKSLETYRAKRDFEVTREPSGAGAKTGASKGAAKGTLSFVVQKHAARRLHYDFRLELDGVLKSWAVAKGPSLVPGEKRLAVHVEDHPLDYGGFEGTIPQGQYGAGSVIVWDRGVWTPESDPHKGYAKGHLNFTLDGEKLKGGWHLVRMAQKPGERGDNWLLIKAHDAFAREADDADVLEALPLSVVSGKAVEAIAGDEAARKWTSGKTASEPAPVAGLSPRQRARGPLPQAASAANADVKPLPTKPLPTKPASARLMASKSKNAGKALEFAMPKAARKLKRPEFIEPCLARLAAIPPSDPAFAHEVKFDGYRLQPTLDDGAVTIRTRRGLDWTRRFPAIAEAIAGLPPVSAIFDGEAVVEDAHGVADFSQLQDALKSGGHSHIVLYMFDLLYLDGYDLRAAPLAERKAALQRILESAPADGPLRYSAHFETNGETLLRHVCGLNAEGIVSKRLDAPYQSGRSSDWFKAKCANRQEFVIVGFAPSAAAPKAIGSLALGFYDGDKLRYAGRAGTGYDAATARALYAQLDAIRRKAAPVEGPLPAEARRGVVWTEPKLVAEIEFRGWTGGTMLRQASFKALRDDKIAKEVVREVAVAPASARPAQPAAKATATAQTSVRLTHPDRVLWPDEGITKQALADYYAMAWPFMAPHVLSRPLALLRCPTGVSHGCFFQKHQWEGADGHIVLRKDPEDGKSLVGIDDFDGLIALVQASVLEIHPWGAKFDDIEAPDRLIFDLDPGDGIAWSDLVTAALDVRARLRDDGLESFVKTSGGKGLHVVAPVAPRSSWADAKAYCRALAEAMATAAPNRFTATMAKRERGGRIFIDYLRNGRGATAVAAYSTRARPRAGISTPIGWGELESLRGGDQFTLSTIGGRLRTLRDDPWRDMAKAKQALPSKAKPAAKKPAAALAKK